MSLALLLAATGCSDGGPIAGERGGTNTVQTEIPRPAQRSAAPAATEPPAQSMVPDPQFKDPDEPEAGAKCTFEARDPGERPKHFVAANHSSNIIFYHRPKGPLWNDIHMKRATAVLGPGELIVAARYRKPDLWIRPKDGGATLEVGDRLACF